MKVVASIAALLAAAACATDTGGGNSAAARALSPDGAQHYSPQYSPDGAHIAYWAPRQDSAGLQLWVANADFSQPTKIAVTGGQNPAVWSADGTSIASASSDFGSPDVVIAPVAGGPAKRMTTNPGIELPVGWIGDHVAYMATSGASIASFMVSVSTGVSVPSVPTEKRPYLAIPSPDGTHLMYNVIDNGKSTIWVADGDGKNPRQLTTEGFEGTSGPSNLWSPDGKSFAYESRRTGRSDIWIANVDGSPPRQLTHDVRNDFAPTWSPDGKWIAFISDRGKQTDVWMVSAAGGDEIRVTDTPDEEQSVTWRPGTQEIAFVSRSQKAGAWAVDIASGKETRLTPDSNRVIWFELSPSGKELLYVIAQGGVQDLAVAPVGGGPPRVLLAGGGTVANPYWSPDGSKIAFNSDRGGTSDVWVIDASGGAPRQLQNWPGSEQGAMWSKDGSHIYFFSDQDSRLGDVWKVPASGGEPVRVTRDGAIIAGIGRRGVSTGFFAVGRLNPKSGTIATALLREDGTLTDLWNTSTAFPGQLSPSGDSVIVSVEQTGKRPINMILSAKTGAGRAILSPNDNAGDWSYDGKSLLFATNIGGVNKLSIMNMADGTTRALTKAGASENSGQFTPDGKTVVVYREQTSQRIMLIDVAKLKGVTK